MKVYEQEQVVGDGGMLVVGKMIGDPLLTDRTGLPLNAEVMPTDPWVTQDKLQAR